MKHCVCDIDGECDELHFSTERPKLADFLSPLALLGVVILVGAAVAARLQGAFQSMTERRKRGRHVS